MAQGGKTMQPLEQCDELPQDLVHLRRKGFYVSTINFIYRTVGWVIWCIGRSCRFNGRSRVGTDIDLIEEAGGSITALATRDGDNLNISNVRFTFDIPDTDDTVIVSMDGWSLLEKGGKVHVEQPDYQEIVVKVAGQDDVTARLGYSVRGDMGVYSEVEDTLIQTWDIASAEVKLIELIAPDYDPAEATVEFVLSMNDAMSNMMYMGNGHQQSVQSLGEMAFDMTIVAPAEDVDLTASATMRGLMSEAFQTVNFNGTPDEILAELKAGGGLRLIILGRDGI